MKKTIQLPKIGIRPVIDGRRMGVRESLEEQTMKMARATAEFLQEVVRHPCGTPVECVIADTCIAGMAESAACDDKFSAQNIGLTITVTPCWCYGSETIDMDPFRPKAIWGFNGTERPGAVYLAAALAAHNQKGLLHQVLRACAWIVTCWETRIITCPAAGKAFRCRADVGTFTDLH